MDRQHGFLDTPIEYLKGVGPKRADMLKKELNIYVFDDLLTFYPFRYVDRTKFQKIKDIRDELNYVQIKGHITNLTTVGVNRSARLVATFTDETGSIELIWFNGFKWLKDSVKIGVHYIIFGKPSLFNNKFNISHPEIETVESADASPVTVNLQPFYSSSEKLRAGGLDSRGIGKLTKTLVAQAAGQLPETLRHDIIENARLMSREAALSTIHFPQDQNSLLKAQARLKFEELFYIQIKLLKQKVYRVQKIKGVSFGTIGKHFNDFFHNNLPFELTGAQKRVLREIRQDAATGKQMNRLLQGDVGSGKTLVALMTMLMALDNGYQSCLMAPTEILAQQHFKTLTRFLEGLDIRVEILTGSTKAAKRRVIHEGLQDGSISIIVGTHALVEDTVQFKNLGLAVIDEQHRFGVAQRARMWQKNEITPHILVMTATPIPRTLAMTLYGDLDISVIDELPPGRVPIKTLHYWDSARLRVFGFMKEQIKKGRQIYIVYPLINESETLDLKHLMDGYESISRSFPLPEYAISIVHGQMKSAEKDYEMQRFIKGETNIMVATTVIEVGVDIPNASVMIIENAERFGLSQLHQLRGRVGRGAEQSYCILMTGNKVSSDGKKRIETMVQTTNGFEIAEADLHLRGPGDLQGLQQSGILDLKIADIVQDEKILKYARGLAMEIINTDPTLEKPENAVILNQLNTTYREKGNWGMIG